LADKLDATIERMVAANILCIVGPDNSRMVAVNERARMPGQGIGMFLFLCALFWHFIDGYWLAFLGLNLLLPNRSLSESHFIKRVQSLGETLYFEGQMDLYESLSKDTLTNAVSLLQNWGVIEFIRIDDPSGMATMCVCVCMCLCVCVCLCLCLCVSVCLMIVLTSRVQMPNPSLRPLFVPRLVMNVGWHPGQRILRLAHEFQEPGRLEELIVKVGRFRKRSRAYRSRRYRHAHKDDITDALAMVRQMTDKTRSSESIASLSASPPPAVIPDLEHARTAAVSPRKLIKRGRSLSIPHLGTSIVCLFPRSRDL
jgi:Glycerol-3-phosphate acyltransferase C-terminal region